MTRPGERKHDPWCEHPYCAAERTFTGAEREEAAHWCPWCRRWICISSWSDDFGGCDECRRTVRALVPRDDYRSVFHREPAEFVEWPCDPCDAWKWAMMRYPESKGVADDLIQCRSIVTPAFEREYLGQWLPEDFLSRKRDETPSANYIISLRAGDIAVPGPGQPERRVKWPWGAGSFVRAVAIGEWPYSPVCDHCGKLATCFGSYDGSEPGYACDTCCGHCREDGSCEPVGGRHG